MRRDARRRARFDLRATLGERSPRAPSRDAASARLDRLLAQMIQLAHRKEESRRERRSVDVAEHERRVAESTELFAQRRRRRAHAWSPATSVISLRTVIVSPSATKTALSGVPAAPNTRTSRRDFRARISVRQRRVARARALEQRASRRAHDLPARRRRACASRAPDESSPRVAIVRTVVTLKPVVGPPTLIRRFEAESVADCNRRATRRRSIRRARTPTTSPSIDALIVRLRARDVVAPIATAVHAAGEAAAEDLHERLDFFDGRRRACRPSRRDRETRDSLRDRRDVLRLLLASFDLETADARVGDRRRGDRRRRGPSRR